jgi:hypothetical protein
MKKISGYLTNFISPSAGFSEGQFKDDPGDGTGSGAVAQTVNDLYYGFLAVAKKYLPGGSISDSNESESASDNMNAFEYMVGIKNENVSEWSNSATYSQDDHVIYLGIQYVSMVNSNTGKNPFDNPKEWLSCFNRENALVKWRNGEDVKGGFEALHDFRSANYRQLFKFGKYNIGGDSGRNFQITALHLDGTVVTGNSTLVSLLDVGGPNEYHLLDVIAPEVTGIRTLLDTRGRVARNVDSLSGNTEDVGASQEDAFQGHRHNADTSGTSAGGAIRDYTLASQTAVSVITNDSDVNQTLATDGINGAPRSGLETVMKNYTTGISFVLILEEIS